jgi:hypothetical protein
MRLFIVICFLYLYREMEQDGLVELAPLLLFDLSLYWRPRAECNCFRWTGTTDRAARSSILDHERLCKTRRKRGDREIGHRETKPAISGRLAQ